MAIKFNGYNKYLGCDEYRLEGSNARMSISNTDDGVISVNLETSPASPRKFCLLLASSFDEILKEFGGTSISLGMWMANGKIIITQKEAKNPEELFKAYKKCCVSFW